MMAIQPLLQVQNISKSFAGNQVLHGISFPLLKGEVHALMGENGAGKSTLMKILAGLLSPDEGSLLLEGNTLQKYTPVERQKVGIAMIHQEILMIPTLTVAQNIFLGRERSISNKFWINDRLLVQKANELLEHLGLNIDASAKMHTLSIAEMQMVEIAKAISQEAKIIIMDEPTSAISDREVAKLFELIKELTSKGIAIIYISHKMEEIFQIADTITVLRDGHHISTVPASTLTNDTLVKLMVGRTIDTLYPPSNANIGEAILQVEQATHHGKFQHVHFKLHRGEVLGLAGLVGAGRTEVALALYGLLDLHEGTIRVKGQHMSIKRPIDAIKAKIGYVSEDRKAIGLITSLSIQQNMSIQSLEQFSQFGWINQSSEKETLLSLVAELQVKCTDLAQLVSSLSGGNQQKIAFAKVLLNDPDIIILDEPTRGVDVGAKFEIYKIIRHLTEKGKAVILISSELPEILGLSDRIVVLSEGKQTATLSKEEATQEKIMKYATLGHHSTLSA